jgi:hypothetical protein
LENSQELEKKLEKTGKTPEKTRLICFCPFNILLSTLNIRNCSITPANLPSILLVWKKPKTHRNLDRPSLPTLLQIPLNAKRWGSGPQQQSGAVFWG